MLDFLPMKQRHNMAHECAYGFLDVHADCGKRHTRRCLRRRDSRYDRIWRDSFWYGNRRYARFPGIFRVFGRRERDRHVVKSRPYRVDIFMYLFAYFGFDARGVLRMRNGDLFDGTGRYVLGLGGMLYNAIVIRFDVCNRRPARIIALHGVGDMDRLIGAPGMNTASRRRDNASRVRCRNRCCRKNCSE